MKLAIRCFLNWFVVSLFLFLFCCWLLLLLLLLPPAAASAVFVFVSFGISWFRCFPFLSRHVVSVLTDWIVCLTIYLGSNHRFLSGFFNWSWYSIQFILQKLVGKRCCHVLLSWRKRLAFQSICCCCYWIECKNWILLSFYFVVAPAIQFARLFILFECVISSLKVYDFVLICELIVPDTRFFPAVFFRVQIDQGNSSILAFRLYRLSFFICTSFTLLPISLVSTRVNFWL